MVRKTMTPELFLTNVVRPALLGLNMPDANAERLLMGTAAQESRFIYTRQIGGGPAFGYFQMEPATHDDCWTNYIDFRSSLKTKILDCIVPAATPSAALMETNPVYAAVMARVRYLRAPGAIPADVLGIAQYWKDNYNTVLGAGTSRISLLHGTRCSPASMTLSTDTMPANPVAGNEVIPGCCAEPVFGLPLERQFCHT
jgi:hypothetical protein